MNPEKATPSVARRAAVGTGWIIAWRFVSRNLGLLSTLVLVRLLAPGDFGLVSLANGLIASVDALASIGVYDALVRAREPDRAMYDTAFTLNALRNLLTAAVIVAIAEPVAAFFDDARLSVVMLALAVRSVLSAFVNIGIVDFRRDLDFRKEFSLNTQCRVSGIVATVACAVIWRSYWALVIGLLLMHLLQIPLSYRMSAFRPRFSLASWRDLIGFSLWTWAQTVLAQIRERSDTLVISRVLGTKQFGTYAVGLELGTLPQTELVEPLGRALFSGFSSLHNASQGVGTMFLTAVTVSFAIVLPAGLGISMIADPMIRLMLGDQWVAATIVVQVTAAASVTAAFVQPAGVALNAIGRPHAATCLSLVSLVVKAVALLTLVPSFGLLGASIALAAAGAVDLLLFTGLVLPHIKVSVVALLLGTARPALATVAMVLSLWALGMAWTQTTAAGFPALCLDVAERSLTGSTIYVAALGGLWVAAGRPDGTERFMLATLVQGWRRISSMATFLRYKAST